MAGSKDSSGGGKGAISQVVGKGSRRHRGRVTATYTMKALTKKGQAHAAKTLQRLHGAPGGGTRATARRRGVAAAGLKNLGVATPKTTGGGTRTSARRRG
jgi:hypothetical protein